MPQITHIATNSKKPRRVTGVSNLPGHRCLPQGGAFPKVMIIRSRLGRLMMWMALAAGAMYFLDPDRGEERRRELRARIDKMRSAAAQPELDAGV